MPEEQKTDVVFTEYGNSAGGRIRLKLDPLLKAHELDYIQRTVNRLGASAGTRFLAAVTADIRRYQTEYTELSQHGRPGSDDRVKYRLERTGRVLASLEKIRKALVVAVPNA